MADNADIRTGRQAIWDLHVQLVFVTKYRRYVFTDDMLKTCENIMRDACKNFGATLEEFSGGANHVYLLVGYPATVAVSKLVNSLKVFPRVSYGEITRMRLPLTCWMGICGRARITQALLVVLYRKPR